MARDHCLSPLQQTHSIFNQALDRALYHTFHHNHNLDLNLNFDTRLDLTYYKRPNPESHFSSDHSTAYSPCLDVRLDHTFYKRHLQEAILAQTTEQPTRPEPTPQPTSDDAVVLDVSVTASNAITLC
jgi:hypothetical protein